MATKCGISRARITLNGVKVRRKESELNAMNNGIAVVPENGDNGHYSLNSPGRGTVTIVDAEPRLPAKSLALTVIM
jgi:hypothetical protein